MTFISVNMLTSGKAGVNILTSSCKYIYTRPALHWCRLSRSVEEGSMVSANTDRTNYLSLALDARMIIRALLQFSETGNETEQLKEALKDTVESLRALTSGGALFSRLHAQFPYQYYEQIKTLQEVRTAMNDDHLADRLSAISDTEDVKEREQNLQLAIAFFSALENRALQRYNSSPAILGR